MKNVLPCNIVDNNGSVCCLDHKNSIKVKRVCSFNIYVLLLSILLLSFKVNAQQRYLDEVFTSIQTNTVTYSTVTNYQMDIYEPVGDTQAKRPLIILAHGGAYVGGNKSNGTMVQACEYFAKRGYVAASVQYTLASNIFSLVDSLEMVDIVMQSVADMKSAIRYMRMDAATANLYKIDPAKVFVGGNSAGAITALHLANIDDEDVIPSYIQTAIDTYGGLEGDRGNPGYSSEVNAVLNWAGGINRLSWLGTNSVPIYSAHGDNDGTVPYDCDDVYSGNPLISFLDLVDLCGSGEIQPVLDSYGVDNQLLTVAGADHVPWGSNSTLRDQMFDESAAFLYKYARCINIKAQLEGFLDTATSLMDTSLKINNLLPNLHPFDSAPYNVSSGTIPVSRFPEATVDWVLLEVRDVANTNNVLEQQTLFIRNDGMVMNKDGTTDINFSTSGTHHIALYPSFRTHF